jgi:hypothetical protein
MVEKSNLVQVSPQEWIRRNPGESDAAVRKRWAQQEAASAAQRNRGERNLRRQENLDSMVVRSNKTIRSSGTGYGNTRN